MKRAKNLAEVDDLLKIIRGNNVAVDLQKAVKGLDYVAQNYQDFFSDCMKVTPRLSKPQLTQAFCMVHPTLPKTDIKQFASSLVLAFAHVRQKSNSVSSGIRTNPVVFELGKQLKKSKPSTLGGSLVTMAKKKLAQPSLGSSSSSSQALLPIQSGVKHPMSWSDDEDDWPICSKQKVHVEEIMSSQELQCKKSSLNAAQPAANQFIEFLDMKSCKLVRKYADKLIEANMKPGDSGYALAWFGDECVQTEMPNLMLEPPVCKRPAAKKVPKKRQLQPFRRMMPAVNVMMTVVLLVLMQK